jgi:ABC-type uncharacterized transport system substrate-binding protein
VRSAVADNLLRRRDLLRFVGGALLAVNASAQARGDLRVLLAGETPQHAALVRAVRERWPRAAAYTDLSAARAERPAPLAYLAVGPRALQAALAVPLDAPLISVLVSRQAYAQLVDRAAAPRGVTAIYAEPSPAQQMRTIAAVFRRRVTVGTFVSASSRYAEPLLRDAAASAGLSLIAEAYEPSISLSRNVLRLTRAEALLIFPDSEVYTPESLRELLESTYRRRLPVIGFSEALVNAGTLASAFASAQDLAAHLAELLAAVSDGRVPAPQYPRYWRVAINDNVARSLDIVIDDSARSLGDRP